MEKNTQFFYQLPGVKKLGCKDCPGYNFSCTKFNSSSYLTINITPKVSQGHVIRLTKVTYIQFLVLDSETTEVSSIKLQNTILETMSET